MGPVSHKFQTHAIDALSAGGDTRAVIHDLQGGKAAAVFQPKPDVRRMPVPHRIDNSFLSNSIHVNRAIEINGLGDPNLRKGAFDAKYIGGLAG